MDGFNISTPDEALNFGEQMLTIAAAALVQAKQLAIASAQLRGLQPTAIASLQNYIEQVKGNQQIVSSLQTKVANTKRLRSLLATIGDTRQM